MNQIIISITERAQREAARVGAPAQAVQTYELPADLVSRALDLGAEVRDDGSVRLAFGVAEARGGWARTCYSCHLWQILDVRPADAAAALDAVGVAQTAHAAALTLAEAAEIERQRVAAERAGECERACETYLAALEVDPTPALRPDGSWPTDRLPGTPTACGRLDGDGYGWPTSLKTRLAALRERVEAEYAERAAVERAAVEAAETTRLARLAELCREHGDESVRARLDAGPEPLGLLPEGEALEVVRGWALPVVGALHEYRPGVTCEVREECDEGCEGSVSWRALAPERAGGLSRGRWAEVEAVRAALLAVDLLTGEICVHRGECDECTAVVERIGIRVERDLGDGLVVEREYQAAE